jgi:DNA-binding GntR family transcriptional regulator
MRLAIEDGKLKPGDRLTVSVLEESLGMSPTPIREALRLLQADGVVTHTPHHGMIVAEFSPQAILEVYRLRIELESLATEWATERADDSVLRALERIHVKFKRAVALNTAGPDVAALNATWHGTIYDAAASPMLREFIERLWTTGGGKAMWISGRAQVAVAEHTAILEAMKLRDPERAAQMMRDHIGGGAALHRDRLQQLGHEVLVPRKAEKISRDGALAS